MQSVGIELMVLFVAEFAEHDIHEEISSAADEVEYDPELQGMQLELDENSEE